MRIEPGLQLGGLWRRRCDTFDDELDLLPHTPAHHRVVAIEAHGETLAIENLFAHPVVDQMLQFSRSCRALPDAFELRLQARHLAARHEYFAGCVDHSAI